jgi:ATP-dependent RNA circularization protein (DNA/RNA ligase family)
MDLNTLRYLDYDDFVALCDKLGLERVPELYRGPWSEDLKKLAEGQSTLADHIREGFVVKPVKERHEHCGRVVFKMVGESYLLRKNG